MSDEDEDNDLHWEYKKYLEDFIRIKRRDIENLFLNLSLLKVLLKENAEGMDRILEQIESICDYEEELSREKGDIKEGKK